MNVFIVSFNDGWNAWKEFVRFKLGEKIQLWISYKWEFNNDVSNTTHGAFVLNFLLNLVNSLAKKPTITSNMIRPIKIKKSIRRIRNVESYEYVRFFRCIAPPNDNSPKHTSTLTNVWEIVSSAFLCQDERYCDPERTVKLNDSICHWKRPSVAKVLFVFHRQPGLTLHACLVSVHGRFFVRQSVRAYACTRSSFHQKERRGLSVVAVGIPRLRIRHFKFFHRHRALRNGNKFGGPWLRLNIPTSRQKNRERNGHSRVSMLVIYFSINSQSPADNFDVSSWW